MTEAPTDPKELYKIIKQQEDLITKLTERVSFLEKRKGKRRPKRKSILYFKEFQNNRK